MFTLKTHIGFYVMVNFILSTVWVLDTTSTRKPTFVELQVVILAVLVWIEALGWMLWFFFI